MNSTWTAANAAQLVKLIREGKSPQIIAEAMGRSRNAICGRAFRMKLHFESKRAEKKLREPVERRDIARFTDEEDQTIREMAGARKSGTDIAATLNRARSSIIQRARRLGMPLRGKDGPAKPAAPKPPKVKAAKPVKLLAGNIANKRESRTHDPVFKHVTPSVPLRPLMVALIDLRPNMCRFPVAGDRADTLFCGHPMEQRAYCAAHARLCYTAPEARRRAA